MQDNIFRGASNDKGIPSIRCACLFATITKLEPLAPVLGCSRVISYFIVCTHSRNHDCTAYNCFVLIIVPIKVLQVSAMQVSLATTLSKHTWRLSKPPARLKCGGREARPRKFAAAAPILSPRTARENARRCITSNQLTLDSKCKA